ncbi:MAG: tripartite tricarboxylate transporter TctB family protein [Alphaproteobacteria bacterium]
MTNPLDTGAVAEAERIDPRADLAIAVVLFLLGAGIVWEAWNMPTFRERQGDIFTAPGIVPGFYGVAIAMLSLALGWRALGRRRRGLGATASEATTTGIAGIALVALLGLVYAVGLVTRLPFWLASALFVAVFVLVFAWKPGATRQARIRLGATAVAIGLGAGIGVALVFERLFLVRLP